MPSFIHRLGALATPIIVERLASANLGILGNGLTTLTSWPIERSKWIWSSTKTPRLPFLGSGWSSVTTRIWMVTPPSRTQGFVNDLKIVSNVGVVVKQA